MEAHLARLAGAGNVGHKECGPLYWPDGTVGPLAIAREALRQDQQAEALQTKLGRYTEHSLALMALVSLLDPSLVDESQWTLRAGPDVSHPDRNFQPMGSLVTLPLGSRALFDEDPNDGLALGWHMESPATQILAWVLDVPRIRTGKHYAWWDALQHGQAYRGPDGKVMWGSSWAVLEVLTGTPYSHPLPLLPPSTVSLLMTAMSPSVDVAKEIRHSWAVSWAQLLSGWRWRCGWDVLRLKSGGFLAAAEIDTSTTKPPVMWIEAHPNGPIDFACPVEYHSSHHTGDSVGEITPTLLTRRWKATTSSNEEGYTFISHAFGRNKKVALRLWLPRGDTTWAVEWPRL
ncbi:MAG: hypothetical protein L0214_01875 [candidate division NC10 bacterium]|nr:hypothetical protein [candidate division NC10 bacterium]